MDVARIVVPLVGAALCAWAALQVIGWTKIPGIGSGRRRKASFENRRSTDTPQKGHETSIPAKELQQANCPNSWKGFRNFKVSAIEAEADSCHSVYLIPCDGKAIANYRPGQHLTLRLQLEEGGKSLIRCYSLSSAFHPSGYRITVKAVAAPTNKPDAPPGRVSSYINSQLRVGQIVEVKAPAGSFFLNEGSDTPIILMAAGVGITPMMSILETLVAENSQRAALLFFGVKNGREQIFGKRLQTIANQHENISLVNCFSQPSESDQPNIDFQVRGRIDKTLLQQVLPHNEFEFYLCGPPSFMDSVYQALIEMQVDDSNIHFEAFGPASIQRVAENRSQQNQQAESAHLSSYKVTFGESEVTTEFVDGEHHSILDVAEASGVFIDSGCRAGSCGTCETGLLAGTVKYPGRDGIHCSPGKCLPCVAVACSDVELEA